MNKLSLSFFACCMALFFSCCFGQDYSGGLNYRTNGKPVLKVLEPVREKLQSTSVVFFLDNKVMLYGLVISPDGMIVTKASELEGKENYYIRINEEKYDSFQLIGIDKEHDLAVVKVPASDLPLLQVDETLPDVGTIVVSNGASTRFSRRARIGVISSPARVIPRQDNDIPYSGLVFGKSLKIENIEEKSPAALAGFKPGDVVLSVEDEQVKELKDMVPVFNEKVIGDMVRFKLERAGKRLELSLVLKSWKEVKGEDNMPKSRNDMMSGYSSRRKTGFDLVLEHDSPLPPNYMGGPLLDLHGNVRGLNIARYNRMETFSLPIKDVLLSAEKLIKERSHQK